ncbi:hypothetical protein [Novosphingobium sp. AAP93]|uniref:hypothetical protein n=1 Tax=Novosphingobium sp. AAP93 TaxID=1523427 RepID=UPI0006B96F55|nr:hypothetical protein [Novosphingobium sp. AAP93]KPF85301.1 hypothetical protein IP83_08700 [Novosphingobium sp. AAP93]
MAHWNRFISRHRAKLLRLVALAVMLSTLPQAAQAMKFYVANALGEVKPEEKVTPAKPQPVQVIFEFQRDGKPNAKATKVVTPWAMEDLKGTGAFSEVTDAPTANGAIISIKFNNLVIKEELDKAKKQAFGAGLGFGLFGGVLAVDHYLVSIDYVPATGAAPIHTEVKHELYSKYGKKDVEVPGTEYKTADEAVKVLVRQALARGVNNIVADPAFPR